MHADGNDFKKFHTGKFEGYIFLSLLFHNAKTHFIFSVAGLY